MSAPSRFRRSGSRVVVVGAGHNGLVAANLLADRGWDVTVLEQADHVGGAVHSDRSLHPDFVTDWYSAFYPLAAASPVLGGLDLARWGLRWRQAPTVLAHIFQDGRCAVLARDAETTAKSLDGFADGDGDAWLELVRSYERVRDPLLQAILRPFPPVRAGLQLARRLGINDGLRFARFAVQPVRRFGEERFAGEGGRVLLAGNALHTDLAPEAAGSAIYGWLLCMLGQTVGFPVPEGGSNGIVDALAARLEQRGGRIRLGIAADRIVVQSGRAAGVRLHDGSTLPADAVIADTSAEHLYRRLVGAEHLPTRMIGDLDNFQWDNPTIKLDWALSEPIPWKASGARDAGTVHLDCDVNGLTRYSASLATGEVPEDPFVLLGQMTTADPCRSPEGTESAWAYTHLPRRIEITDDLVAAHVNTVENIIERQAPGFRAHIIARRVQSPLDLEHANPNLALGAVGGGTSALHQQLIFRPVVGLGRADTVIDGVYLGSAAAHPGGGVHGGPGSNAAHSVLRRAGKSGAAYRRMVDRAFRRIYR